MASEPARPATIRRFGRTERVAHWLLAATFLAMLATGLVLYLPVLAPLLDRPTAKRIHLLAAIALGVGLVLVAVAGDRRALRRLLREVDRFDRDDLRWLAGGPRRLVDHDDAPPQGRLNAGQKANTALTAGLLVVLALTGTLLWLGERDTTYRLAGTVLVHDLASVLVGLLVAGHLYLALVHPATRPALRGIVRGDVDRRWAERHHARWAAEAAPTPTDAATGGAADRR